nr:immunoglobulin light chain junction region [Macaca mulatta]
CSSDVGSNTNDIF